MNEVNMKKDETVEYGQTQYKVVENKIIQGKTKKQAFVAINVLALVLMGMVFVIYYIAINIMGVNSQSGEFGLVDMIAYFVGTIAIFLLFICVHELVHYYTYHILGKTPKDKLKFGIVPKMGMAYCIALEPNTLKASRLSLMMPVYLLVVPTIILAIALQSGYVAFLAALFASGSGGDIWYMWTLRKESEDKYIIESMPEGKEYEIGYLVLEKIK